MDCDSYMQSKYVAAFFKVQEMISGISLQTNKKRDSDSTMLGQKGKYRCSLGILILKMESFSINRLWSDSLNLL